MFHTALHRRSAATSTTVAAALAMSVVGAVAGPANAEQFVTPSCRGFDVGFTISDVTGTPPMSHSWHRFPNVTGAGQVTFTLENMSTGRTIAVKYSGSSSSDPKEPVPGATTFYAKGAILVLLDGSWRAPQGPSTTLYKGLVALKDDNDVGTVTQLAGTSTDICAVLAN